MRDPICPEPNWLCEYVDGALPPKRRESVSRHLESCARCRAEVAGARKLRAAMLADGGAEAPEGLGERIGRGLEGAAAIRPIGCRMARGRMDGELDGQLELREREELRAHLFNCGNCLRRFEERKRVVATLRVPAAVEAPSELFGRIRAAVAALGQEPVRQPRRSWASAGAALAAASVMLALVLTIRPGPQVAPTATPGTPGANIAEAARSVAATPEAPSVVVRAPEPAVVAVKGRLGGRALPVTTGTRSRAGRPETVRAALLRPAPSRGTTLPSAVTPGPAAPVAAPAPVELQPVAVEAPRIAATPPAPLAPAPVATPAPSPGARPLVTHTPTAEVRELRLVPAQPASVVVFQRQPDNDVALAEAGKALQSYERDLQRTKPREIAIRR